MHRRMLAQLNNTKICKLGYLLSLAQLHNCTTALLHTLLQVVQWDASSSTPSSVTSLSGQLERQNMMHFKTNLVQADPYMKLIIGCDPSVGAKQKLQGPTCMRTFSRAVAQNGSIHRLRLHVLPHHLRRGPNLPLWE